MGWGQVGRLLVLGISPTRADLAICPLGLTLIAELEADVRVTLIGGEEEVEVVAGADEELGDLSPMVNPDQGRGVSPSISHFQSIIIHLGFKSAEDGDDDFLRNPRLINVQMTKGLV